MTISGEAYRAEVKRKAIHLITGAIPLAYGLGLPRDWVLAVFLLMTVAMFMLEFIRRSDLWAARLFHRCVGETLRSEEKGPALLGAPHYCAASLCCVYFFPREVAVLGLLYLAIGDTAASLVGMRWGRMRIGRKSLEGLAACWVACSAVGFTAWVCDPAYLLLPALAAAPVAAIVETLTPGRLDNWSIPLSAAGVIVGVQWAIG